MCRSWQLLYCAVAMVAAVTAKGTAGNGKHGAPSHHLLPHRTVVRQLIRGVRSLFNNPKGLTHPANNIFGINRQRYQA